MADAVDLVPVGLGQDPVGGPEASIRMADCPDLDPIAVTVEMRRGRPAREIGLIGAMRGWAGAVANSGPCRENFE
jgi:hypothetical protein